MFAAFDCVMVLLVLLLAWVVATAVATLVTGGHIANTGDVLPVDPPALLVAAGTAAVAWVVALAVAFVEEPEVPPPDVLEVAAIVALVAALEVALMVAPSVLVAWRSGPACTFAATPPAINTAKTRSMALTFTSFAVERIHYSFALIQHFSEQGFGPAADKI